MIIGIGIRILTLPFNNNYGGYLQAYALMTVLKRMGHDVELIYRRPNRSPFFRRLIYPLKTLVKIILRRPHGSFIMNPESDLRRSWKLLMPFVDKYISPRTKPYYTTTDMEKSCIGKYDVVIVGSDQVWRPLYVPNIKKYRDCESIMEWKAFANRYLKKLKFRENEII